MYQQSLFAKPNESDWSIFWLVVLFLEFVGLAYIGVSSRNSNDPTSFTIYVLMVVFTLAGVIMTLFSDKYNVFKFGHWYQESLFFSAGFIAWLFINMKRTAASTINFSLITFKESPLTVVSANMPILLNFVFTVFLIPIAEEFAFLIFIPQIIFLILDQIATKKRAFANKFLQIGIAATISGVLFGLFHTGNQNLSFFIGAFAFRFIMVFLVYAFTQYSHITKSFAVGAHIGNNWAAFGFINGVNVAIQNFMPVGMIIIIFFLAIIITAIGVPISRAMKNRG